MNLLGAKMYDPSVAVSKATTALLAMTAVDTTNLRAAITVPAHGMVHIVLKCAMEGNTTFAQVLLGAMNGATVIGRMTPQATINGTALATSRVALWAEFTATGLTPGAMNLDAAYGVEVVVAGTNIKYGGPNDTTTDNAWGGFLIEAWDPQPMQTNGQLVVDANGRTDVSKISGTAQTARDIGASVLLSSGNGAGQLDFTSGIVKADAVQFLGAAISAPATAGVLDVNVKNMNNVSASAVTTIKAVQGLTTADTISTVTGNVAGSVGSVTARVTANADQLAGQTITAAAGVTFPTSVASPTNITAGTITTVTNLTNAPTAGDFTAAMKTSMNAATPASVTGAVGSVTGAVGSVTGNVGGSVVGSVASVVGAVGSVTGSVGSVVANVGITQAGADRVWASGTRELSAGTNIVLAKGTGVIGFNDIAAGAAMTLTSAYDPAKTAAQAGDSMTLTAGYDAAKSAASQASVNAIPTTPLLASSYTAPDNAGIAAVKSQTDKLTFAAGNYLDVNITQVNGITISGSGTDVLPWGPA